MQYPVVVVLILNVTVAGYVDYVALMFKLVKVSAVDLSTHTLRMLSLVELLIVEIWVH